MNIVEQFERIKFWLDVVASPRFDVSQIENALNDAIYSVTDSKYDSSQKQLSQDSFQRTQKVRDELSNLISTPAGWIDGGSPVVDDFQNTFTIELKTETKYRYLLCARAKNSTGTIFNLWPLTYNRKNILPNNPFRKPRSTFFGKWYYIEKGSTLIIYTPTTEANITVEVYYLKDPNKARWGNTYTSSKSFIQGNVVIPLDTVEYGNQTYKRGQDFIIAASPFTITSGSVLFDHEETDLNKQTHEGVCRIAALNLLLTTKETDKYKELKEKMMLS